jgi:hypothetical protein
MITCDDLVTFEKERDDELDKDDMLADSVFVPCVKHLSRANGLDRQHERLVHTR